MLKSAHELVAEALAAGESDDRVDRAVREALKFNANRLALRSMRRVMDVLPKSAQASHNPLKRLGAIASGTAGERLYGAVLSRETFYGGTTRTRWGTPWVNHPLSDGSTGKLRLVAEDNPFIHGVHGVQANRQRFALHSLHIDDSIDSLGVVTHNWETDGTSIPVLTISRVGQTVRTANKDSLFGGQSDHFSDMPTNDYVTTEGHEVTAKSEEGSFLLQTTEDILDLLSV